MYKELEKKLDQAFNYYYLISYGIGLAVYEKYFTEIKNQFFLRFIASLPIMIGLIIQLIYAIIFYILEKKKKL